MVGVTLCLHVVLEFLFVLIADEEEKSSLCQRPVEVDIPVVL